MRDALRSIRNAGQDVIGRVTGLFGLRRYLWTRRIAHQASEGMFSTGEVLAVRFDGFGPRLGEMMNAWRIARAAGAQFVFAWPETGADGAVPVDEVFEGQYLRKHLRPAADLSEYQPVDEWQPRDLAALRDTSLRGVMLRSKDNHHGEGKFVLATRGFDFEQLPTMAEAYWALPLLPGLEMIRETVRDGWPGVDTSIHVRRGDVVSGWFRLGGASAKKALPAPIVRALAQEHDGQTTVLIGNSLEAVLRECDGLDVTTPDRLFPSLPSTPIAALIRDMTAISLTKNVIAGSSLFARVGALIGGVQPQDARELMEGARAHELLLAAVEDAAKSGRSGFEEALNCDYLRTVILEPADRRIDRALVPVARASDPENPTYLFASAVHALRDGRFLEAQQLLESSLSDAQMMDTLFSLMKFELDIERGPGWSIMTTGSGFLRAEDWELLDEKVSVVPSARTFIACQRLAERDFYRFGLHCDVLRSDPNIPPEARLLVELLLDLPSNIPERIGGFALEPRSSDLERA